MIQMIHGEILVKKRLKKWDEVTQSLKEKQKKACGTKAYRKLMPKKTFKVYSKVEYDNTLEIVQSLTIIT